MKQRRIWMAAPMLSMAMMAQQPAAVAAPEATPAPTPMPEPPAKPVPVAFSNGLKAMDESRWQDALAAFDKVETGNGEYADASLYWKAYSLEKLGRRDDARGACDVLRSRAPQSSWNLECELLSVNTDASPGKIQIKLDAMQKDGAKYDANAEQYRIDAALMAANDGHVKWVEEGNMRQLQDLHGAHEQRVDIDPEDDLKLLALNSLMRQEPDKALPVLRTFLNSDKPVEVRRRAMFVLAESKSPAAQQLLVEMAENGKDPELQRSAVQMLATMHSKDAGPELVKIYQSSSDQSVKRAAVSGLFLAHDAKDLVELSRAEKDMSLKRDIVSQLALMRDPAATAYMEELLK